jgi:hypothetical protein
MKIIGKSGLLLNIALWGKKYNKNVTTKDPTKKPCVLYLSMENSIDETIERLWSHYVGEEVEIRDYSSKEALEMLSKAGFNNDGISLVIKYRPNRSINTADLDAMIDDLAMEGYEVVMLVQDYIKRIRSINSHPDLRLELGAVVDEFAVIAKDRGIPIVTASQLNREAFRIVENAEGKKSNLAKQLGASQAGESMLMIENADFAFIQAREYKQSTEKTYLTLKRIAGRGKDTSFNYFAHPFINGMKLDEDEGSLKTLSILDLGDDLANFDPSSNVFSNNNSNNISPIKDKKKERKVLSNLQIEV